VKLNKVKLNVYKHQNKFIRSKAKYPALVCGYGAGKTTAFVLMGMRQCGLNPSGTILLAEPTYPMIKDVLQPTLEKMLDAVGWIYNYSASDLRYRVQWRDGWADIILRSAENFRRWAGLNLSAGGIDEADLLKTNDAWMMLLSRIREGRSLQAFITTTPEGFGYVYNLWKEEPKQGYELIQGRTVDNKSLPSEFIESLKSNYDEQLQKAYLDGEFCHIFGSRQTYYCFSRIKNVKKNNYNADLPIRIGNDQNVNPMCSVLWQKYKDNPKIRIFDEVILRHSGGNELMTERMCREIKTRYPKNIYLMYPDSSSLQRRTSARRTDATIMKDEGMSVIMDRRNPPVSDRINCMNKAMESLIIDPSCKNIIKDLEMVTNKEGSNFDIDKSNKELSHSSDALGYSVIKCYPLKKHNVRALPR
tara:strand:+ start:8673 stop:9923 length:1251 start_codon:yes stop_codon:yes gene_type:complete